MVLGRFWLECGCELLSSTEYNIGGEDGIVLSVRTARQHQVTSLEDFCPPIAKVLLHR